MDVFHDLMECDMTFILSADPHTHDAFGVLLEISVYYICVSDLLTQNVFFLNSRLVLYYD